MTVVGIAMVRDEDDIVDLVFNHMLWHVDHIVVLDNRSVDRTREILDALPRTTVIDDPVIGYYQAEKMTRLAHYAREMGADWVVPFDADEFWCAGETGLIRHVLEGQSDDFDVVEADFFHHINTGQDEEGEDIVARWVWREGESRIPKVACRARPGLAISQGNHSASYFDAPALVAGDRVLIHHFPYRSGEQMARKALNGAEAYEATDLPYAQGSHWRQQAEAIRADPAEADRMFRRWFAPNPVERNMVRDPTPVRRERATPEAR